MRERWPSRSSTGSVDGRARRRRSRPPTTRIDRELWQALADANLLGIALPEDVGGSGLGLVELCLLLEQQGRVVAPVPLWATVVLGALPIAEFGTAAQRDAWLPGVVAGDVFLTAALAEAGVNDVLRPQVRATRARAAGGSTGLKPSVPAAHVAARVLVPAMIAGDGDADGASACSWSTPRARA